MSQEEYLRPGKYVDSHHPRVISFAREKVSSSNRKTAAIDLYYAVRDGWKYDPYRIDLSQQGLKASDLLLRDYGYCIEKSNLYAAACRAVGIPSRVGFANVRNHIGVEKYEKLTGSDILAYHGYAEIFLNNHWIKVTPVFNKELCERLNVAPLEFDGERNSVFQEFGKAGQRFMEYLEEHGVYADIPREMILEGIKKYYPRFTDTAFLNANGFSVRFN